MYNDYYLIKRVQEEESTIALASVQDDFTFKGEVVQVPCKRELVGVNMVVDLTNPQIGDKVIFLKGSGEDVNVNGETYKVVKFEDIIMKI